MGSKHTKSLALWACHVSTKAPTSVLGSVCAPGWVVLPQPLHSVLDSPDLLLDLPAECLILNTQGSQGSRQGFPAFSSL